MKTLSRTNENGPPMGAGRLDQGERGGCTQIARNQ